MMMVDTDFVNLVQGDHTRTVSIATPSAGGIMKFAVKKTTCLGCRAPLKKGGKCMLLPFCIDTKILMLSSHTIDHPAVCAQCKPRLTAIHLHQVRLILVW